MELGERPGIEIGAGARRQGNEALDVNTGLLGLGLPQHDEFVTERRLTRWRRLHAVGVDTQLHRRDLDRGDIRKGDTLDSISKKRGLSIKELQQYNKDLTSVGASASQGLLRARSAVRATAACGRRAR